MKICSNRADLDATLLGYSPVTVLVPSPVSASHPHLDSWKPACPCSWGRGRSGAEVSCTRGSWWLWTWWASRWPRTGWSPGLDGARRSSCRRWTSRRSCSSRTPARSKQRSADKIQTKQAHQMSACLKTLIKLQQAQHTVLEWVFLQQQILLMKHKKWIKCWSS